MWGLKMIKERWDKIKEDAIKHKADLGGYDFHCINELIDAIVYETYPKNEAELEKYARYLIGTVEHCMPGASLMSNRDKPIIKRMPSAASYMIGCYLEDEQLKRKSISVFAKRNLAYAHDLAETVRDLLNVKFTSEMIIKENQRGGGWPTGIDRAWYSSVRHRFADLLKESDPASPKTVGLWMQCHKLEDLVWVMDTLGYQKEQRELALEFSKL
jgi:hypothetical protein